MSRNSCDRCGGIQDSHTDDSPNRVDDRASKAWEEGVRQAITWLRADYPYGEGPDWREHGCEWIADRLAEHTATPGAPA